jgi:hypothetical protein
MAGSLNAREEEVSPNSHPQPSNEELARRGQQLYEQQIRDKVEKGNEGKILAIDVGTGDYEMDDDVLAAAHRLLARHPGSAIFTMRIGYNGVYGFGGGPRRVKR